MGGLTDTVAFLLHSTLLVAIFSVSEEGKLALCTKLPSKLHWSGMREFKLDVMSFNEKLETVLIDPGKPWQSGINAFSIQNSATILY